MSKYLFLRKILLKKTNSPISVAEIQPLTITSFTVGLWFLVRTFSFAFYHINFPPSGSEMLSHSHLQK